MPSVPDAVSFRVPTDADPDAVIRELGRYVELSDGASVVADRMYLDTFDGRVARAGLELWRDGRGRRDGAVRMTLMNQGRRSEALIATPPEPNRILIDALPEGNLRQQLAAVIEERALLPQVRVHSRIRTIAVCNRDTKTVVRIEVEEPAVGVRGQGRVMLAPRMRLTSVLGYDNEFAEVVGALRAKVGLLPGETLLVDEALLAIGSPAGGVSSKVDVALKPSMRAYDATVLVGRRLAEVVEANLPGTLADIDTEFLHDLRVAVRRTRSVLKEMKGVLPAAEVGQARVDLRWIQEITGPTRDLDVQLHDWPAMVSNVSPELASDLLPLHQLLADHRQAAFATMRRQLKSRRYQDAWAAWRALLDRPPPGKKRAGPKAMVPVGELAGSRIVSVYRAMVTDGSAIDDASVPEALHDLRKRGKELRYLLELFGGMWPAATVKPLVSTLKGLQDVLGRFQDGQIQIAYLRQLGPELAARPGGTDALIALGPVIDRLVADQTAARTAFADRFRPFAGSENAALMRRVFSAKKDPAKRSKGA